MAPAFGQNITYEYTASILNLLDNYTLNNLTIRFFLPENVTPFMSGTPNTSTFNISSNMGMYWNESDGVGNWTYDGVAVRTNCTNQTDKMPGSPNYNGIMMMCLRIYELQLVSASFGNWLPHSDASNVTLKFNATMSFPALEENANTPASVGSSNYYNASFSSSVQTNLDLTAKVPGIASAGCANTVVILDGQTLTCNSNYTLGSLTLLNTGSGSHSLSVSYSIPAITGVGGGTTQDCGSCALDGVCRSCCASDPDCPAGATPAPTPAGAGVPTPTVLEITPTPSVSAGETPTETSSEETGAETPSTELSSANAYIRDARTGMLDAQVKGYDVSDVQRLIGLAEQARDGGDYALAKQYAQQAQDLVSAKMSAQLQKAGAADWMPIAAVLAVLVIGGAWYFFGRKK
ncbi:hypothetical protein COU36_05365 [Candidatus Micrarchaeota archaeon CG10_big_fil_rev_8_21_14_0_10_59_7]|nr:MAG: hypothetical protein COU36_05365 [Candidatus Micrarchaeota archaeon CG10_big_fil_rev_8_21_14_0_10_59_7]